MKILRKFWQKGKRQPIRRYGTNPRVLAQKLASLNWEKVYLKVSYGKELDVFDKLTEFYNDGYYTDKKELKKAFKAFTTEEHKKRWFK